MQHEGTIVVIDEVSYTKEDTESMEAVIRAIDGWQRSVRDEEVMVSIVGIL